MPANRTCWDIDRAASFDAVSSWCLRKRGVDRLIVAIRSAADGRNRRSFDPRLDASVREIFGDGILRLASARAWPGTQLIGHTGKAYVIAFDAAVQQRMAERQERLSGWKQSNGLPEDVCLYREGDDWPVLVSVTHDGDAWLFDDAPDADFVRVPQIPLPLDLIPPPPTFIQE